ncbi:hypothetical protein CTAYLR_004033 [Chrysophaeum taylorii]|uniref:tRNA-dihydrouridine(16/17) synthase [NAD(P)(+)] n=1 Tax=Chrysophaeum taylorii TaxID=2483200 RepID=A0AAD7XID7_9STRA|nr:hypothetical protein CTAYLR_004033 [Chrysophaeum taylorii]
MCNTDDRWERWERELGSPKFVCAPMVDQSDFAFRELVRSRGVDLCYSPMLLAEQMESAAYRDRYLPKDRCVVQLGGRKEAVLRAARFISQQQQPIDLNLGCPQRCARRKGFGAYLSDDEAIDIVKRLKCSAKIRKRSDTVEFAKRLAAAGASFIAVHGRTVDQKARGPADWDVVREVVLALPEVPIILNGNVRSREDAIAGLRYTGAAAVMSAEPLLAMPSLFRGPELARDAARAYLTLAAAHDTPLPWVREHISAILHEDVVDFRDVDGADFFCYPPVRRDLLSTEDREKAEKRRAERHKFKAMIAGLRIPVPRHGRSGGCPRCANPSKKTCPKR